ncbi:MAG: BadF/BadG/BcrA/BcrD ATPase family protein [Nocardioidaceae bacterium]
MTRPPALPGSVLAIDAGNSKTDIAVVRADGTVASTARGSGFDPHVMGAADAVAILAGLVSTAAISAGLDGHGNAPLVEHVSACLANADLPVEQAQVEREITARGWGRSVFVGNDTLALLRAGVKEPKGIAVVCGAGINCSGLRPDGQTVQFAAVGTISGDWGGGGHLSLEALWWAARADDGRGPLTELSRALPAHFGLPTMAALIESLHLGRISTAQRLELTPVLFSVAAEGDAVARLVVQRQAEEIVALAVATLRRLEFLHEPVDVVLGGGVLTARHPLLLDAIGELLATEAPCAVPKVVTTPPVVGAALLGLDHVGAPDDVHVTLRAAFSAPAFIA